jgi:hypothetical protein
MATQISEHTKMKVSRSINHHMVAAARLFIGLWGIGKKRKFYRGFDRRQFEISRALFHFTGAFNAGSNVRPL